MDRFNKAKAERTYKFLRSQYIEFRTQFDWEENDYHGLDREWNEVDNVYVCPKDVFQTYTGLLSVGKHGSFWLLSQTIWVENEGRNESNVAHCLHHEMAHSLGWTRELSNWRFTYEECEYAAEMIACMVSEQVGIYDARQDFVRYVQAHVHDHPFAVKKAAMFRTAERIYDKLYG